MPTTRGELDHQLRIVDVAARRQVVHEQVVAHQQLELRDVVGVEAEALGDAARQRRAAVRVVAALPLAGVVEEHGEVEHARRRRSRASPR